MTEILDNLVDGKLYFPNFKGLSDLSEEDLFYLKLKESDFIIDFLTYYDNLQKKYPSVMFLYDHFCKNDFYYVKFHSSNGHSRNNGYNFTVHYNNKIKEKNGLVIINKITTTLTTKTFMYVKTFDENNNFDFKEQIYSTNNDINQNIYCFSKEDDLKKFIADKLDELEYLEG